MPSTPVTAPRPAFSIERILGLEQETSRDSKLHRPWAEISPEKENNSSNRCIEPQQHQQHHHHLQRLKSNRPTLNWYIGRRPRTAFTNSQVNVMETVFQMNCYPGIQLREQLADRLDLDEDRIQPLAPFLSRRSGSRTAGPSCGDPSEKAVSSWSRRLWPTLRRDRRSEVN
ncbi:homeobox expressed in ES cells 1 isoform X2 [Nelusetta ayraudi]|uniref:homeobox expressed in ES cells 1 isoform X2 n=1 Tax=Nelusetta ayraudi TaxID=303726 RepID=UPI003F7012BF